MENAAFLQKLQVDTSTIRLRHQQLAAQLKDYHSLYYCELRPFFMRGIVEELEQQLVEYQQQVTQKQTEIERQLSVISEVCNTGIQNDLLEKFNSSIMCLQQKIFDVKQLIEIK